MLDADALPRRWYADPWLWLCAFLPAAIGLPMWGSDFFYGDESRHAMNGVLIPSGLCAEDRGTPAI